MGFFVVTNGCDILRKKQNMNIRDLYGIDDYDFLFVFVGNVNTNKNQKQVVDSFALLHKEIQLHIKILFVGGGEYHKLEKYIGDKNLSDSLFVHGPIDKGNVHNIYIAADATILTSLSEGFGLSIIEGFVYGKPNLTFSDLPAVHDLYNPECMLLCENRHDKTLADKLVEMTKTKWNKDFIIDYARKFSFEQMGKNYNFLYTAIKDK